MRPEDRRSLASFVRARRLELDLSPNKLAHRTTTHASTFILDIEAGTRTELTLKQAHQLARGLELDPYETDHFLHLAGCATVIDWKKLAEEIVIEHDLTEELRRRARDLYAKRGPNPDPRRRP